jgi:hypothetical protein
MMKPMIAILRWVRIFISWWGVITKKGRSRKKPAQKQKCVGRLDVRRGFAETLDAIAFLPLTSLAKELNAFEALEHVAFNYESLRTLEAFVL